MLPPCVTLCIKNKRKSRQNSERSCFARGVMNKEQFAGKWLRVKIKRIRKQHHPYTAAVLKILVVRVILTDITTRSRILMRKCIKRNKSETLYWEMRRTRNKGVPVGMPADPLYQWIKTIFHHPARLKGGNIWTSFTLSFNKKKTIWKLESLSEETFHEPLNLSKFPY